MPPPTARYAPSPTGSLHLGNLRTAVASYASARARGMKFLLRIEDLDQPRCRADYEEQQLQDLRRLGLEWDEEPLRQSSRAHVYAEMLERLDRKRLVYPCFCSRKDIREALSAPHGPSGNVYPRTCAPLPRPEAEKRIAAGAQHSWRLRVDQAPKVLFDGFHGEVPMDLEHEGGDFVVRRADGLYSYQLACAVDDALSGVTEVLRGDDLLDSAARQAYLLACLELPVPRYLHITLMHGKDGQRLAKRIGSEDLTGFLERGYDVAAILSYLAWTLGQCAAGERIAIEELIRRWDLRKIPCDPVVFRESDLEKFRPGH